HPSGGMKTQKSQKTAIISFSQQLQSVENIASCWYVGMYVGMSWGFFDCIYSRCLRSSHQHPTNHLGPYTDRRTTDKSFPFSYDICETCHYRSTPDHHHAHGQDGYFSDRSLR
uniref:Uncharacterized protein n=1 Tax=Myripristis murdjan TaxID=586833 RepID=A0A667XQW8_9TELE